MDADSIRAAAVRLYAPGQSPGCYVIFGWVGMKGVFFTGADSAVLLCLWTTTAGGLVGLLCMVWFQVASAGPVCGLLPHVLFTQVLAQFLALAVEAPCLGAAG